MRRVAARRASASQTGSGPAFDAVVAPAAAPVTSTNEAKIAQTLARGALPFDPARSHRADDNALKSFGPRKHREFAAVTTASTGALYQQPSDGDGGDGVHVAQEGAGHRRETDIYTTTFVPPQDGPATESDADIFATFVPWWPRRRQTTTPFSMRRTKMARASHKG